MPNDDASAHFRNPLRRVAATLRELHQRHKTRHRPTGFGFLSADCIDYVDPVKWDALANGRSVFLRRDLLRVIEEFGPENIEPRYAMIFREREPVALVAAQLLTVTGDRLAPVKSEMREKRSRKALRKVLAPAARVAQANLRERILVAGNLLCWGCHGFAFAPDENPADLWPAVAEVLYRLRRAERLAGQTDLIMIKDLTPREPEAAVLRRFSYQPLETEPNMVLQLDPAWHSYEDYLAALDAKYRRNAKDQQKKLAAAGCGLAPLTDLRPHAPKLHEHYLSVHSNASVRLVTLPEAFLPALSTAAGTDFRCTGIRRGDELLGFVTSLRDGDTSIAYYIGFDRAAAAAGLPLYLQLLHATIGHAIDWRCRRISFGRTALEPKAALGAKPEPMSVWMRHRVPALNWVLRGVLGAVPHQEAPERNPLKQRPG